MIILSGVRHVNCHSLDSPRIGRVMGTRIVGSGGTRVVVTGMTNIGDVTTTGTGNTGVTAIGRVAFTTPAFVSTANTDRPTISNTISTAGGNTFMTGTMGNGTNICLFRIANGAGHPIGFSRGTCRRGYHRGTVRCTNGFVGRLCVGTRMISGHCLFFWL